MAVKTINAVIQLRRDNEYNFNRIAQTYVPLNGEVVLVDTPREGLRAKVGDGVTNYLGLEFVDEDLRNTVQQGYYSNNAFYRDSAKTVLSPAMVNKIYIDKASSRIYFYDGTDYVLAEGSIPRANDVQAGIMKLYATVGQNTDGTMTQKAITDGLNTKFSASVDAPEELLVFSI